MKTNPNAMLTIQKNTIFTNVAETSDGGYYWEGLEEGEYNPDASVTTWKNEENWQMNSGTVAAHPNSRSVAAAAAAPQLEVRDRKSTRLNSSHTSKSRMPSSA